MEVLAPSPMVCGTEVHSQMSSKSSCPGVGCKHPPRKRIQGGSRGAELKEINPVGTQMAPRSNAVITVYIFQMKNLRLVQLKVLAGMVARAEGVVVYWVWSCRWGRWTSSGDGCW